MQALNELVDPSTRGDPHSPCWSAATPVGAGSGSQQASPNGWVHDFPDPELGKAIPSRVYD
jgi:hypothetical protein